MFSLQVGVILRRSLRGRVRGGGSAVRTMVVEEVVVVAVREVGEGMVDEV